MTGKERGILESFRDDLAEMKGDVKKLLGFMATYTEKSIGCERRFRELEESTKWTKGKVLLILGFGGGVGFALGTLLKL